MTNKKQQPYLNTEGKITCRECGGVEFYAHEDYIWQVSFDPKDRSVDFTDEESEIKGIYCKFCDTQVDVPDGYQYNFN